MVRHQLAHSRKDLPAEPRERWRRLGHGYRVQPRIVMWESNEAVRVPASALFRSGEQWALFVAQHGRAQLREVRIGHQDEMYAEVLHGVQVGDRVVVHPNDRIADGTRIARRKLQ